MTDERDELKAHIHDSAVPVNGRYVLTDDSVADAILAAGYRKPRQVTTVEELDALPVESVVRSDMGNVYVKDYALDDPSAIWWVTAGAVSEFQSNRIALPATVLHVGGAS